jgi:archaellum component FlaC
MNQSESQQILTEIRELKQGFNRLSTDVERLSTDVERFNDRFSNYQQATQWVVQLAFTLIASATLTVIITAVLKR